MDKVLHFLVCCIGTILVSIGTFFLGNTASLFCGGLFSLGLGLGKEYGDNEASGNKWDWYDILADLAGIAVGILVVFVFRKFAHQ